MSLELIGIVTILLGLLTLRLGANFGIYVQCFLLLLGMAAGLKLPALGGSSIQPAHLFLPFYVLSVFRYSSNFNRLQRVLTFPNSGFWLAAFVLYGVFCALFLPRVFQGGTEVILLRRIAGVDSSIITTTLLGPTGSNITQSVYLLGSLMIFLTATVHILSGGINHIVKAVLLAIAGNILFAFLDVATYATGTTFLLDIIRNANYALLAGGEIGGIKRIVGSYPEASAFGGVTLIMFVFATELWLQGIRQNQTAVLSIISFFLILLSTSSSAYFGFGIYCTLLGIRSLWAILSQRASAPHVAIGLVVPLVVVVIGLGMALDQSTSTAVSNLVEKTITHKLQSHSGVERGMWNAYGLQAFHDTLGFGAGVGSVRTSSFFIALLASVGVLGTLFFAIFMLTLPLYLSRGSSLRAYPIMRAALWCCIVSLAPAAVAGTTVDLGMSFSIYAALVTAPTLTSTKRLREKTLRVKSQPSARKQLGARA